MDHGVRLYLAQRPVNSSLVGDIKPHIIIAGLLHDVGADAFQSAPAQLMHHIIAELTSDAGNKNLHFICSHTFSHNNPDTRR